MVARPFDAYFRGRPQALFLINLGQTARSTGGYGFSRHDCWIRANFFIGFKDCSAIGDIIPAPVKRAFVEMCFFPFSSLALSKTSIIVNSGFTNSGVSPWKPAHLQTVERNARFSQRQLPSACPMPPYAFFVCSCFAALRFFALWSWYCWRTDTEKQEHIPWLPVCASASKEGDIPAPKHKRRRISSTPFAFMDKGTL